MSIFISLLSTNLKKTAESVMRNVNQGKTEEELIDH